MSRAPLSELQQVIRTLGDIVSVQASHQPAAAALIYEGNETSFAKLETVSHQVANQLLALGLPAQSRIAVMIRNSDDFFPILFGAAKAGMVVVTINFRLTAPEMSYILEDSGARVLFADADFQEAATDCCRTLSALEHVILLSGHAGDGDGLSAWLTSTSEAAPDIDVQPDHTAVQMYTSGTTGAPKGVELTHRGMIVAAEEGLTLWTALFRDNSAVLATMPLFHIAACNLCLAALYAGGRAVIVRDTHPADTLKLIAAQSITVVPLPATVIHEMTSLDIVDQVDLSALDTMLIAGSGIPVATLKAAQAKLGCGFALSYGMTECCGGLSYLGPQDCTFDAGKKLESAGKPFGENRLKIVGPDGEQLAPYATGEILCKSKRVMKSYWNRPDETAQALQDGWYHSGDAGYVDENGFLYVVDRIKDMVISGGENIYPVEIENALIHHPSVRDVAVIGIPDEKWGESLLALTIADGPKPQDQELIEFLRPRLAGYKIPRKFAWVDAFPRNATGKVLKRELRTRWGSAR